MRVDCFGLLIKVSAFPAPDVLIVRECEEAVRHLAGQLLIGQSAISYSRQNFCETSGISLMLRFSKAQKCSMPFVCTLPSTYFSA
jgi:hypothetical protein